MTCEKARRTPLCMGAQAYLFFRAAPRRKKNCNVLRAGRLSFQGEFPFGGAPLTPPCPIKEKPARSKAVGRRSRCSLPCQADGIGKNFDYYLDERQEKS